MKKIKWKHLVTVIALFITWRSFKLTPMLGIQDDIDTRMEIIETDFNRVIKNYGKHDITNDIKNVYFERNFYIFLSDNRNRSENIKYYDDIKLK